MTRGSQGFRQLPLLSLNLNVAARFGSTGFSLCAFFVVLGAVLFTLSGCNKKTSSTSSGIRAITREFVFAARKASSGRAEVATHPEYTPRQPGSGQVLVSDRIYITVPLTREGLPDNSAREAIDKELARVAKLHHLQRIALAGAPGMERFDYMLDGRRTHSIQLMIPAISSSAAPVSQRPRLAIVIDDLGHDRAQADALFQLSYPLTLSVLPYLPDSGAIAEEAHRRGYHVMLHLPIASTGGKRDEPIELHPGMDSGSVGQAFAAMLDTVPYATGVNNHEGSLGTSDRSLMDELMPLLRRRNLYFIDSRTTAATVAEAAAHEAGVPTTSRNVFLDDEQSLGPIRKQFALAIHDAKEQGSALAIGHPHQETLQVLTEMLPEAQREGVTLVFASDLVH